MPEPISAPLESINRLVIVKMPPADPGNPSGDWTGELKLYALSKPKTLFESRSGTNRFRPFATSGPRRFAVGDALDTTTPPSSSPAPMTARQPSTGRLVAGSSQERKAVSTLRPTLDVTTGRLASGRGAGCSQVAEGVLPFLKPNAMPLTCEHVASHSVRYTIGPFGLPSAPMMGGNITPGTVLRKRGSPSGEYAFRVPLLPKRVAA